MLTLRVSHFLESSGGNHDGHRNLEAQHSGGHVNLTNINKDSGPKTVICSNNVIINSLKNSITDVLNS